MIDKFIKIFEGLEFEHTVNLKRKQQNIFKVEGRPWVTKKPVTKELWENHLQGVGPNLGIFPLKTMAPVNGELLILTTITTIIKIY